MGKKYTITTPIYYVNSVPHIGTALTTLASDVTARYQKMRGKDVFFLTGTDENAIKVKEAAEALGKDPRAFVDQIAGEFQKIWPGINIQYDDFIRTTEPRHKRAVEEFWRILQEKGHIYQGTYEGWYDVGSETFYKEIDLVDGKSPDGNEVRWVQENNYFFRMSTFGEALLNHIQANPRFILPESRRNEVVSFIGQGLRDVCISRQNPGWGIPVPGDPSQVVYVWFDALINYVAATGWPDNPDWQDRWPAEVQWMGKDILTRFHATLWPAMLLGVGLPLPETLVGHGWILIGGEKISKSKGNVIAPLELARSLAAKAGCQQDLAVDVVRYYMAAVLPMDNDSTFTQEDFDLRYNSDLANDLGNSLHRTLSLVSKLAEGVIPDGELDPMVETLIKNLREFYERSMANFRLDLAADAALQIARELNKHIANRKPWEPSNRAEAPQILRSMLMYVRALEGMIRPFMPTTANSIAAQLGLPPLTEWKDLGTPESLPAGVSIGEAKVLFPRIIEEGIAAADLLANGLLDEVLHLNPRLIDAQPDIVGRQGAHIIIVEVKRGRPNPDQLLNQLERQKAAVERHYGYEVASLWVYLVESGDFFDVHDYAQAVSQGVRMKSIPSKNNPPTAARAASADATRNVDSPKSQTQDQIQIADFAKVQLRVARIVEAEPVEKSDKLMKLQVMIGEEKRQIVAGIRKDYEPIDLIGRQIVVVYNLKPAMLRGVESQGMLLAATKEDGGAILLQPESEAPEGSRVK